MADTQDDAYAARRADLDARFRALPAAGTVAYWHHIEDTDQATALPLEVLARCLRERYAAGKAEAARHIFEAIVPRIQRHVQVWAHHIATPAFGGMKPELEEELEQECYLELWATLIGEARTFLLVHFFHTLGTIQQHVAHSVMERAGEWKRRGVQKPTRVPRSSIMSVEAHAREEAEGTHRHQPIHDPDATDAFEQAELVSDVHAMLEALPAEPRALVYDAYFRGLTQHEIAEKWGITDRTVRNRLTAILAQLRALNPDGEEDQRG